MGILYCVGERKATHILTHLVYNNNIIIITTSFAPISSKIKLSCTIKPRD